MMYQYFIISLVLRNFGMSWIKVNKKSTMLRKETFNASIITRYYMMVDRSRLLINNLMSFKTC